MRDFGPDLFAGTAAYYSKYRAKYPHNFFNDVMHYFDLDGRGQMLDLGCGTGELAIPLAKFFEKILAVDPEPQMLQCARRKGRAAKLSNVEWRNGSSKDLKQVEGLFKLITLGQSFHWMDTKTTLDELYNLLDNRGGLCLIGSGSMPPAIQSEVTAAKDEAIKRLITKYLGPERRAGNGIYVSTNENWEENLFPDSKFGSFEKRTYITKVVRNIDQELGNLFSMSWARRDYFGQKLAAFEQEFRQDLQQISPAGRFENTVKFEAYFLVKDRALRN